MFVSKEVVSKYIFSCSYLRKSSAQLKLVAPGEILGRMPLPEWRTFYRNFLTISKKFHLTTPTCIKERQIQITSHYLSSMLICKLRLNVEVIHISIATDAVSLLQLWQHSVSIVLELPILQVTRYSNCISKVIIHFKDIRKIFAKLQIIHRQYDTTNYCQPMLYYSSYCYLPLCIHCSVILGAGGVDAMI